MTSRLTDIESRRWFWRPALVAAAGAIAIGIAILLNFWYAEDVEEAAPDPARSVVVAPAPTAPAPGVQEAPLPSFDVVRINPNGDTVIAGRAVPGAVVVLRDDDSELGTVTADARGEWVLLPETPLPPGAHRLTLLMRDEAGAEVASTQEVLVVVPKPGEDVGGRPGDATAQPLVLRIPRDGGPATVLQKPLSGAAEGTFGLDSVHWQDGRIVLDGHAPAQTRVRLSVDGNTLGETLADSNGRWRLEPKAAFRGERRMLTLEQLDGRGSVMARQVMPLALQDLAALTAGKEQADGQLLVVAPGTNLWRIARATYGRGAAYTIIYQANREQIEDPDRIYPGQVFRMPGSSAEKARE